MSFPLRGALAAAFLLGAAPALAEITVTDLRGRTVTLAEPGQRVMLGFYCEDFLTVTGPGAVDRIVGLSRGPWAEWRPGQWAAYTGAFPQLNAREWTKHGGHAARFLFATVSRPSRTAALVTATL